MYPIWEFSSIQFTVLTENATPGTLSSRPKTRRGFVPVSNAPVSEPHLWETSNTPSKVIQGLDRPELPDPNHWETQEPWQPGDTRQGGTG